MTLAIRRADPADAAAIAEIHDQGIAERIATFRAEPRPPAEVVAAIGGRGPVLVAERDDVVVGWASVGAYDDASPWYAGIGEATVYVAHEARGAGAGSALLAALERAAATDCRHKLIAKIFDTNAASLRLFEASGYRRVGVHHRHGTLDGEWKDVVVLEKLLGHQALGPGSG